MSPRLTTEEFISRSKEVHGDRYDYSRVAYETAYTPIEIGCPVHGFFTKKPLKHLYSGQGCPECGKARKGNKTKEGRKRNAEAKRNNFAEGFLDRAAAVHGDTYDYSQVRYAGIKAPITIICPEHGPFTQTPDKHLQGRGCISCGQRSAPELEVLEFVNSFEYEVDHRCRSLIFPKEVDIYVPEKNLAIEFCGLYWHSTIKTKPDRARVRHREKYDLCADKGVRLITIYEDEWKNRRPQVEAILARALSDGGSIYARSCDVCLVDDPREFYNSHHIQGAPRRGLHYGLVYSGEVVACMTFAKGASQRGSYSWELLRYASGSRVVGGASRLMRAFIKENDPDSIVSFSDNRYFGGGMYDALGFILEDELKPDYSVVMPGGKRVHKSLFKRAAIPTRIKELKSGDIFDPSTDPRTEWDMIESLGCGRIYDCGKKKWVWSKK